MYKTNRQYLIGLFFCIIGSVCAGPVIGAESEESAGAANGAGPGEREVETIGLFDSTGMDDGQSDDGQTVEVGSFGQIDLHVKDLELTKVLQLLSIQSQRNIIASRNVSGTVSADLYNVDFYEALDAILYTNGFGYREKGNFIYVYTAEELDQLVEQERKTIHKIIRLNYINAADASNFVSPLLSASGSIAVSGEAKTGFQPSMSDGGENSYAHTDTLIIRDYPENVTEILAVLEELDVRPKQVLIEATVLQARLTENNALGVDFAIFFDLNVTDFATPLGAVANLISGSDQAGDKIDSGGAMTTSVGNVSSGTSGMKIGVVGSDAAVYIRALDSVTDTNVLAMPKLLVLNRQKADLLVGEKLGYLSTTVTETSQTQTVEFLDVGTQLTVRPFVGEDNFVRIEMRPSVSDGSTDRTVNNFVIPETTTQEMTTNVIVKSGKTIILGGLFKEDTSTNREQVPGIGDIPLLGSAFRGHNDTVTRSEIIFLIKPTVIRDKVLYEMGDDFQDRSETLMIGSREGLLPWSRTKMTNAHVRQALKYLEEGDKQRALWRVNLALYLDPTMTDAMELREELTGEKFFYRFQSIMKDEIDELLDDQIGEMEVDALLDEVLGDSPEPVDEPGDAAAAESQPDAAAAADTAGSDDLWSWDDQNAEESQPQTSAFADYDLSADEPAEKKDQSAGRTVYTFESDFEDDTYEDTETGQDLFDMSYQAEKDDAAADGSWQPAEQSYEQTFEQTYEQTFEQTGEQPYDQAATVNVFDVINGFLPGEDPNAVEQTQAEQEYETFSEAETPYYADPGQ